MRKKNGFTLLEILVATIIFSLVMLGLMSVFIGGKRFVMHSRDRMSGGELGKLFLEPLQMYVRQDTWGMAGNLLNTGNTTGTPVVVNNISYTPTYNMSDVQTNLRRVVTTINWTEN